MTRMWMMLNRALLAALVACLAPAAAAFAQGADNPSSALADRYSGRIASVETAERALEEVKAERSGIEERFAAARHACYTDFFANACIDKAREERRAALEDVRKVEVEANSFLRHAKVVERDKALEEKRLEREQKETERLSQEQAAGPKKPKEQKAVRTQPLPAGTEVKPGEADPRVKQHEDRLRRLEAKERAQAQKRADNIAAHERKVREAEKRQRQVEEKKKQRELERAEK